MVERMIRVIANLVSTIFTAGINKLYEFLKKNQIDKIINIATYVENVYIGEVGYFKKEMFIAICKKVGCISLKFADYYLEKYIIPVTKAINTYTFEAKEENKDIVV